MVPEVFTECGANSSVEPIGMPIGLRVISNCKQILHAYNLAEVDKELSRNLFLLYVSKDTGGLYIKTQWLVNDMDKSQAVICCIRSVTVSFLKRPVIASRNRLPQGFRNRSTKI